MRTPNFSRQRGQAMVEMAVMAGIIVFLFLGIWLLGKFHDVQASTIQAARYVAWERTVHPASQMSDAKLEQVTRERFFTWNQNPFKSTDGKQNGQSWGNQSAMWVGPSGNTKIVAKPDDVTVRTSNASLPGAAATLVQDGFGKLDAFLSAVSGGEKLPDGGMATGVVSVKLNNLPDMPDALSNLNLTLTERSAVVMDSWDANGPKQAALRTRGFTLTGPLAQLDSYAAPLKAVVSWLEPSMSDFHIGQICPDVVPADRVNGGNPPAYGGAKCY